VANGTKTPFLGVFKVQFEVARREHTVATAVVKAVKELIFGVDFLTYKKCQWDFSTGRIHLGDNWVQLQNSNVPDALCLVWSSPSIGHHALSSVTVRDPA